ncbi:VOC family protein [Marinibacterium sp. SX1]|uniref:VOC family protein n=1 Tax=Marinibacterium sp. SX1 TaxID=3388424 RepID=UPI003D163B67
MQPTPYLFFAGNCHEAFTRYGEIFGSDPMIMTFAALPEAERADMPGAPVDAVMHAAVRIGEGEIFGSDDIGGAPPAMDGCNIAVSLPDDGETRRVWDALAEGAEVRMPLEPTFFAPLFGTLTDRFGIRWMIMQDMDAPPG